jgi:TetR/AcrR family transcriptional repressor of mexJK operon
MTKVERVALRPTEPKVQSPSAGKAPRILREHAAHNSGRRVSTRHGPGRPTAARVEAINRAILIQARNEFRNSGYDAARMEAIAAAAGVSKATLYDRYPTKEALLRAVIADRVATWSEDWEPDGGPIPSDLRQRLKHRAHKLMQYYCSGRLQLLERLFASAPSMNELRSTRHEVGHKRIVQVIAQDIIDGTRDQSIEPGTGTRIGEMLIAMLYGWWRAQQEIRRVTPEEALAYADQAVDILLDGRAAWAGAQSA